MIENDEYEGRVRALGIMVVMVIFILLARVGYLQVMDGEYYANLADGNRIRIIPSMAPRGTFFDRH
ncbi:MAG: penicillin-binding protein 2, partial [Selenomonadaceae bacterium]|nr:penicillin-binding protein 2 [Selenomonadaceae bacterium]